MDAKLRSVYEYDGSVNIHILGYLYHLTEERLQEPATNISHKTMPTQQEHEDFWAARPYRRAYVITDQTGDLMGFSSITDRNEIGIIIGKQYRRRGLGMFAVRAMMTLNDPLPAIPSARPGRFVANIAVGNIASERLFRKLGFTMIQSTFAQEDSNGTAPLR